MGRELGTYRHPGSFRGSDIANAKLLGVISYRFISEDNGAIISHFRPSSGWFLDPERRKGTTVTRNDAFVSPRGILHTLEGSQSLDTPTETHTQAHPQDLTGVIHRSKPRPHTSR